MVAAHVVFSPCPFRAAALDFLCACCYWILFISLCCDFPFDLFDRPGTFSHCTPPDTPTLPLFNSFHCNWLLKHKLFLLLFRFHWTNSSVFFCCSLAASIRLWCASCIFFLFKNRYNKKIGKQQQKEERAKNVSVFGMRARLSSFGFPEFSRGQNMFPIDAKLGTALMMQNWCRWFL